MALGRSEGAQAETERTAAEDLLMLIYTSGTTGRPKGAVHTHCGFPLKAAMDMALGLDLRQEDVLYWMTDMGWMMGPWEVFGTLLLGSTVLFYDGAPDYPDVDRLWSLVERHKITALGVSPTLIRSLMQHGDEPPGRHDLSSLRTMASTGEPWNPAPWLWLFNTVGGGRCPIINYSGGTEISGGIVMGNVMLPLKPCAFSGPRGHGGRRGGRGRPQRARAVGELVVREPWIGMTRGFWHDPERYIETYWSRWPDVWVHGDWAAVDADGLWYILGRSDDTIKVAGKRLGPAEVETVLVHHPAVVEAGAIGVPDEIKGQALVVFCVLAPGTAADSWPPSCAGSSPRTWASRWRPRRVLRARPAQNAQRQGHAPRPARRLSGRAGRRPERVGQPGSGRADPSIAKAREAVKLSCT